ncbi:hypothetical protein Vadar_017462 [Vaccinium darrowii]|uniref:Uncharacterized protein n=1 Tax=Vaccinium darrowii TaxID=229202 RepID=A0ACB7Z4E8_9ERIC|nr:hypothetical protein Vadar_017462 [Vaccinium darrowii]
MELKQEEEVAEPVSPTGQYFNSSVLSVSVLGVLESQVPIDDSPTLTLLQDVFLPINPRFSSIMVRDKNGVKQWKKVKVNLQDHINVPIFPNNSTQLYDQEFNDYLTKISLSQLPQSRPLWEIHIIKYPTKTAAGHVVFKLHHALGDGFSIMGALLSCLQRADNPSLPLTFPQLRTDLSLDSEGSKGILNVFSAFLNTVSDFGWSLMKSSFAEDDRTPIRSGDDGVEFRPIDICTITFCLDQIKLIKSNLQVTINDVITGIIFFGTRLYMQQTGQDHSTKSNSTALVLLNTRNIAGYKSVDEMLTKSSRGKKNSAAVFLTGKLLDTSRKYIGPEATARHIHNTLKNSSMTVSNVVGPVEQMALANHPCSGIYFMVVGVPQSLTITMVSYMGKLRVAVGTEKGHIDSDKYKSCIQNAFDMMFKVAVNSSTQTN